MNHSTSTNNRYCSCRVQRWADCRNPMLFDTFYSQRELLVRTYVHKVIDAVHFYR